MKRTVDLTENSAFSQPDINILDFKVFPWTGFRLVSLLRMYNPIRWSYAGQLKIERSEESGSHMKTENFVSAVVLQSRQSLGDQVVACVLGAMPS